MREKRTRRWFVWALLCAACLGAGAVHAEDPVYFADANLKEIVEDFLDKEDPTPTDMLSLTDLQAYDCGIVDLTGLEYAQNLTWLELDGNYVSDISALACLTHLDFLSLLGNRVSDISSLVGLTSLSYLSLDDNEIADVSPLAALTNLRDLGLGDNQIGDISALSGLTNLEWLALGWNEVTDLSALSGMANLQILELDGNQISDLSPLSTLANLNTLELNDNRIGDLTALSSLTRLYELSVASNEICDLSPLSTLANLSTLELNDNRIGDLTPLSTLTNLSHLDLSSNRINDISPLLGLTNLDYLALDDNPLNICAYCSDLYVIDKANPGLSLSYSANPNPPEGLSATDGSHTNKVAVEWIAPCEGPTRTDDFEYRVYRSISLAGTKEAVSDWLSDTFFDDATASPGVHYWYWVKSNESGDCYSEPDEGWRSAPSQRTLTISSAAGGTVSTPGIGSFQYDDGSSVSIVAVADTDCSFTGWTGTAVDAGKVADLSMATTTVTVDGDYTLRANFAAPQRTLAVSATAGGRILAPGEGTFEYDDGAIVGLQAEADPLFVFIAWRGSAFSTANPYSLTMDRDVAIRAHFESILDVLYVDDDSASDPGPGDPNIGDPWQDGTPEHPFDSVQEAIDVAKTGSRVVVRSGVYFETIDLLGKSIEIRGLDANDPNMLPLPVIDAAGADTVVRCAQGEDPNCILCGFVITGGKGRLGGGILCVGSSPTILNCLVVGNCVTNRTTGGGNLLRGQQRGIHQLHGFRQLCG